VTAPYAGAQRCFEGFFAILFGAAALKVLTAKID
jgi:hypothetical protein